MTKIHPSAVIERGAKVHDSVEIGPFCVVGANVELHEGVKLFNHVCVD